MLPLISSDFPDSDVLNFAPVAILESGFNNQGITTFNPTPRSPLATSGTVAYSGIPVTLPDTVSVVTLVRIGLEFSEFTYSPITHQLIVSSTTTGILYYQGLLNRYTVKIPTNRIVRNIPPLLKAWNLNGTLTLKKELLGHPSASFSFLTSVTNEASVKTAFTPGTAYTLYGVGYVVAASPKITHFPTAKKIRCEISLQGSHTSRSDRSLLDKPIQLKPLAPLTTLATLCNQVGLTYSGPNIPIKIDKDTGEEAYTTVRSELSDRRLAIYGVFPDFNSPNILRLKTFRETPLHFLSDADVLQKNYTIEYRGQGASYQDVPLYKELNNTKLRLQVPSEDGDEKLTVYEGDPNPQIAPDIDKNALHNPAMAYPDGPKKRRKKVETINGQTTYEEEEEWGFLCTSEDTHVTSIDGSGNVKIRQKDLTFDSFWQQCRLIKTTYKYDDNGYLIASPGQGFEYTRFEKETQNLELSQLQAEFLQETNETEQAKINDKKEKYRFFKQPTNSETTHTLEKFSKYYSDTTKSDTPPKFAQETSFKESSFNSIPNPDSTKENQLPPLSVGKSSTQSKFVTIVNAKRPEVFKESDTSQTSEGGGFQNSASIANSRDVSGRPPVQSRLKIFGKPSNQKSLESEKKKYYLNTPNSLFLQDSNTLEFPDVSEAATGRLAAQNLISMENSRNASHLSLLTRRKPDLEVGDLLFYRGITWWILGIDETQQIKFKQLNCKSYRLSLGQLLDIPVFLTSSD